MYCKGQSLSHQSALEVSTPREIPDQSDPWLVVLPGELGSSIVATVALNRLLSHCRRSEIKLQIACLPYLSPLYSMVSGVDKVWGIGPDASLPEEFDENYGAILDFDGTATISALHGRLHANKWYATRLQECPGGQGNSIAEDSGSSGGPVFQLDGIGVSGDADQPAWLLEAEVAARALNENIWEWKRQGEEPRLHIAPDRLNMLSNHLCTQEPYVIFAPCGGATAKHWPMSNWMSLLGLILQRYAGRDVHILLGPSEGEYYGPFADSLAALKTDTRQRCQLHRSSNILEACALAWKSDLFVANDCGPMHLAAALGKPVLAVFGPTNPRCWFCYSGNHRRYAWIECAESNKWGILEEKSGRPWPCWPSAEEVFSIASEILGV